MLVVAGTTLGLALSAMARTEEVAVALAPIAVIPQIILAGAIAPLTGLSAVLAKGGITAYWGKQALDSLLPASDWQFLGSEQPEFLGPLLMLALHAALFAAVTAIALWKSGRKAA
jgi:hypothetical protein